MQTLKNNFLQLSEKLNEFNQINLNKAKAKDVVVQNVEDEYYLTFPNDENNFSMYSKKGVKSDFIKLFKSKTKKEKYSIGFHFEYLNVKEPVIQCSIKQGNNFMITDKMSLDDFKEKLNNLNLTLNNPSVEDAIEKTQSLFFNPSINNKNKFYKR